MGASAPGADRRAPAAHRMRHLAFDLMVVRFRLLLLLSAICGALAAAALATPARAAQFVDLSAGGRSTCAVAPTGRLFCWGDGREGQLGRIGALTARHPVRVIGIYDAQRVSVGVDFGCTVLARGSQINVQGIYACWGNGTSGQLGTGAFDRAQYPQQVRTPDGFTRVAAGSAFACGVARGGAVWCWGADQFGQLGDGAVQPQLASPVQVPGVSGITELAVGNQHACGVRSDAVLLCWGRVTDGQTGLVPQPDMPPVTFATPVGVSDVIGVAAGSVHTCALRRDGSVWCFGQNPAGQLGSGVPVGTLSGTPVQVPGVAGATAIAAGGQTTCAIVAGGSVVCWGGGQDGKLGNGARDNSATPVAVRDLSGAVKLSVGDMHACALTSKGAAFCWGSNRYGQLGSGDVTGLTARETTPVRVRDFDLGRLTFVPRALESFPTGTAGGVIEARRFIVRKTSSRYACPKRGTIRISANGKAATRKVSFTRRSRTACRLSGSFALPSGSKGATVARYSVRGTHLRTVSGTLRAQRVS